MGDKEKVRRWIDEMPDGANAERIGTEILRRHRGEVPERVTDAGVRRGAVPPKRHPVAELLPLLTIPLFFAAIFLVMPVMFRLGDAIVGEKPRVPVARGRVMELRTADAGEVHYDWVKITRGDEVVFLPRERIRSMRLKKE